jgi:hypothetical protein
VDAYLIELDSLRTLNSAQQGLILTPCRVAGRWAKQE